jgi:flagellin
MSFRINTNISSIQAQTTSTRVNRETEESSAKLSSGQRITKAADDAAGLAISEKIKSEIRSSKQANRNANDGISLVQTAEGGLNESSGLLTRMRELSIQAASDTLTDSDRAKSSMEYEQIKLELDRISQSTEFNGKKLLNGTGSRLDFQVGVGSHSSDDIISYRPDKVNSTVSALGVAGARITNKQSAQESLSTIDRAINRISEQRSILGSIQNRLTTSSNNLTLYNENISATNSRIRDLDYAAETSNHARLSILGSANAAVMGQANTSPQAALKLLS